MDNIDETEELRNLVEHSDLGRPEDFVAARRLAQSIEDDGERAWTLYELVKKFTTVGDWDKAESIALMIDMPYEQANAFREIAARLISVGEEARAIINLVAAEKAALSGVRFVAWQPSEALARIGEMWLRVNQRDQALRVWDRAIAIARTGEESDDIQESIDCSSVLWEIAERLSGAGCLNAGQTLANSIKNIVKRERAISSVERMAKGENGSW